MLPNKPQIESICSINYPKKICETITCYEQYYLKSSIDSCFNKQFCFVHNFSGLITDDTNKGHQYQNSKVSMDGNKDKVINLMSTVVP